MIKMTIAGKTVLILEPGNLEVLKKGHPLIVNDDIAISYTPDLDRFTQELKARKIMEQPSSLDRITGVDALLEESLKWPVVMRDSIWLKDEKDETNN